MTLRLTGMLAMIGAIAGFLASFAEPPRYIGATVVRFLRNNAPAGAYDARTKRLVEMIPPRVLQDDYLARIVHEDSNLGELIGLYSQDELNALLRANIHMDAIPLEGQQMGLRVSYEDDDAQRAMSGALQVARAAVQIASAGNRAGLAEIAGSPETTRSAKDGAIYSGIGAGSGAILGLLLSVFQPRRR